MARAQAAAASDQRSFLRKIWPETFSRGQMVTAAAALALVVTVSTFYINRDRLAQAPNGAAVAVKASHPRSLTAGGADSAVAASGIEASESESGGLTPAKYTSRSVKVATASFQLEDQFEGQPENAGSPTDIAGIDDSTRLYNPETKRLLKARSRFYGAETVSISMAKPAGAALTF
jgi:threonine dehydrogenase-like Zn-dependent dehydrogenase